jgi:photosystem II stability/assembly factor-like uncharacterized protein
MRLTLRTVMIRVALPLLTILSGQLAAAESAPIMPLASRSLLLDITLAAERIVVAGERGHILYSDDNGSTWQQANVPTTQMLTGIHFVDAQRGWAAGHDGLILASSDGGENWRIQRDGIAAQDQANLELRERSLQKIEQLQQQLETSDEETLADLELELEDAVMDLEDADLALEELVFTSPFMDIWFQDRNRGWAVGAFGALVTTTDGGRHWSSQQQLVDNPDEFHLNTVTGDGEGRVFIAGEGGVMFRSLDGGDNWETIEPFYDGSWFGTVYEAQRDVLLAFGLRGNLFRSTDFGASWDPIINDNHITLAGGTSGPEGEIVLVGGVGTVLRSNDGGESFQRTMIEDRLSLSSGMSRKGRLILVGQGGAKTRKDTE